MRGMFLCVIMVLVPLASAFSSPNIIDEEYGLEIWYESVVYSEGEVWDSVLWEEVIDAGAYPLRTIDRNRLLIWQNDGFEVSEKWSIISPDFATWNSDLSVDNSNFDAIKILFEPRLPDSAYYQIENDLRQIGVFVSGMDSWKYSPMAHKVIVEKPASLDLLLKVPGVLWVEPVLTTYARNLGASAFMSDGDIATHCTAWDYEEGA